jgi:NAD(P)H-hydrate epimerase
MLIRTKDEIAITNVFKNFILPKRNSHKGDNGKILIIGGSSLFHAASIWAAEIASHFVDIVHYYSTEENEKIFFNLKSKFLNGIVVPKKFLLDYVKEDDVILIGPGMIRDLKFKNNKKLLTKNLLNREGFKKILSFKNEGKFTYFLTKFLIENFPEKKFVFDAGSLQMMDKNWLLKLKVKPILTPHQKEFEELFQIKITSLSFNEKEKIVKDVAKKYQSVILLKAINDIISDGEEVFNIEGGNQGLSKGGTGDILAGLTASFYTKNNPLMSAVYASILLKKTADVLFEDFGYWYNINNLLVKIPQVLKQIILKK